MPINSEEGLFEILNKERKLSDQETNDALEYINNMNDINIKIDGDSPLILAALNNHIELASALIYRGADINTQDSFGNTPLMLAATNNKKDIVELLIFNGADVNLTNSEYKNALELTKNHTIKSILEEKTIMVDHPFNQGWLTTPHDILNNKGVCYGLSLETSRWYMKHIAKGEDEESLNVMDKLNRILNNEKDVNNFIKRIALYQSEQFDINNKVSDLTINYEYKKNDFIGSLPDEIRNKKFIGFVFAVLNHNGESESGHIISVRKIGDKEKYEVIDANFGSTKCENNKELNNHIEKLLYHYQKNHYYTKEFKALDLEGIIERRNWAYEPILDTDSQEQQETKKSSNKSKKYHLDLELSHAILANSPKEYIESLINDTNINMPDNNGKTPLYLALKQGSMDIADLLKRNGADIDAPIDKNGTTTLIACCARSDTDIVNKLLDHGADPNKTDIDNNTALIFASFAGDVEIVESLISANADLNIQGEDGKTALMFAIEENNINTAKLLIKKGADIDIADKNNKKVIDYASNNQEMMSILAGKILNKHIKTRANIDETNIKNLSNNLPPSDLNTRKKNELDKSR